RLLRLVAARQLEHREVQCVEAGERDELEAVAHGAQLALESGDLRIVELALPVEGRRAVVRQRLVRELRVDSFGEFPRLLQVRPGGLAPQEVRVRGIGAAAGDRALQSRLDREESCPCPARGAVGEWPVAVVCFAFQELGASWISSARRRVLLTRRTTAGTESAGYSD